MTQHSSLKSAAVGVRHRNVLKRNERIKALRESERWGDRSSAYKLPKMKLLKIKMKKEKTKQEGTEGETGATAATAAKAPGSQEQVPPKTQPKQGKAAAK